MPNYVTQKMIIFLYVQFEQTQAGWIEDMNRLSEIESFSNSVRQFPYTVDGMIAVKTKTIF